MIAKISTFATNTTTGNQTVTVTGLGGAPKALFFFRSYATATGTLAQANWWISAAISSTARAAFSGKSDDNQSSGQTYRYWSQTALLYWKVGGFELEADLVSVGTSGSDGTFTINISQNTAAVAYTIAYLAIAGNDVSANVVSWTAATSTGAQAVAHGLGVTPAALLTFGATSTSSPQSGTNFGAALGMHGGGASAALMLTDEDGAADTDSRRALTTQFIDHYAISDGTRDRYASVSSLDATNVNLSWTVTTSSAVYNSLLALAGINAKVGTFSTPNAATQSITGVGFQPDLVLFISVLSPTNTAVQDSLAGMIGADNGTQAIAQGSLVEDAQGTTDTDRYGNLTNSIAMYDFTPTATVTGKVSSFNADGFDLSYSAYDATAREVAYLALGTIPAGGANPKYPLGGIMFNGPFRRVVA